MFNYFRNRQKIEKKQRLLTYGIFAIITVLLLTTSAIASFKYFANKQNPEILLNEEIPDGEFALDFDLSNVAEEDKQTVNVLLAGFGGAGHQGGYLSDVIQVAHFNFEKKQIIFISIPRDLYLMGQNQQGYKVNALMSVGMRDGGIDAGLELLQKNISQITGLPIKYFIGVDFVGFKRTIGYELKGIEVEVSQTLDDPWYPIDGAQLDPCGYSESEIAEFTNSLSGFALESKFKCRYEHIYFPTGTHTMEGHEALAYVRSRHSSSDYDRSHRQVEILNAIKKKLFQLEAIKYVPKYYQAFSQHVTTNLDLESAKILAPLLANAQDFSIQTINLSPENVLQSSKANNGAFILTPKSGFNEWGEVQGFIKQAINK